MTTSIDSTAKREFRSFICFLQTERNNSAAEIHQRIMQVNGENSVSDEVVHEWCQNFKEVELMSTMNEGGQGGKSVTTENIVRRVNY